MTPAKVLVSEHFMALPHWFDLYVDFYNYKICGDYPDHWGRDAHLYQKPLWHIQMTDCPGVTTRWRLIHDPFYRTVRASEAAHDLWLLYAVDEVDNRFLMLDVFGPHAHAHPRFQSYVRELQDQIVSP